MSKNLKLIILVAISLAMVVFWAALAFTSTKYKTINYWWQAMLSASAIIFGIFGLLSAKQWSWLKSGVGRSVFFISGGLIMWGLGQAVWSYDVLTNPSQQSPNSLLLNVLYWSALPFWAYGILKLSKATGAKYGLRPLKAKVLAAALIIVMFAISYVVLVNVARGGSAYFHQNYSFLDYFWDLGYAAGDAINLIIASIIFGFSWKYLGGKFKRPILVTLFAFLLIYLADFWFSYRDGQHLYYNGDWTDLLYLLAVTTFGVGLCLMDPTSKSQQVPEVATIDPPSPQAFTTSAPAPMPAQAPVTTPSQDLPSLSSEPAEPAAAPAPTSNNDNQGGGQ